MLGIQFAESKWTPPGGTEGAYLDAVGDIAGARLGPYPTKEAAQADYGARKTAGKQVPIPVAYKQETFKGQTGWWAINTVWGCSVGGPQIRCLDDPSSGNHADTFRDAAVLHDDPDAQARAALEISSHGTKFDLWSTFRNKSDLPYRGKDYTLRRGHPRAADWDM